MLKLNQICFPLFTRTRFSENVKQIKGKQFNQTLAWRNRNCCNTLDPIETNLKELLQYDNLVEIFMVVYLDEVS